MPGNGRENWGRRGLRQGFLAKATKTGRAAAPDGDADSVGWNAKSVALAVDFQADPQVPEPGRGGFQAETRLDLVEVAGGEN